MSIVRDDSGRALARSVLQSWGYACSFARERRATYSISHMFCAPMYAPPMIEAQKLSDICDGIVDSVA
jgi:hypothetical protein